MARIIGKPKSILRDHQANPDAQAHALEEQQRPIVIDAAKRPVLIVSGCRWEATGGGQRPVQLARAIKSLGRDVIYAGTHGGRFVTEEGIPVVSVADIAENFATLSRVSSLAFCEYPNAYQFCIPLRNWCRVMDLCDDWSEFQKAGLLGPTGWTERVQRVACLDSHVTTYSADLLGDQAREYGAEHTVFLPNAGPAAPLPNDNPPEDLLRGTVTTVFVGCLWGNWLDWKAVAKLAKDLAEVGGTVNVIGGMELAARRAEFPQMENIRYHGAKVYPEAMRYVAACDVGLIPFKGEGICKAVDPVKYYDYIAAGIPVVATRVLGEIRGRPYVTLAGPQSLTPAVLKAAKARVPAEYVREFCERESWVERAKVLLAVPNMEGIWI